MRLVDIVVFADVHYCVHAPSYSNKCIIATGYYVQFMCTKIVCPSYRTGAV